MVTAKDIHRAWTLWVASFGTDREAQTKADLVTLVAQAKRENGARAQVGAS